MTLIPQISFLNAQSWKIFRLDLLKICDTLWPDSYSLIIKSSFWNGNDKEIGVIINQ
jgi:hypothetical protein